MSHRTLVLLWSLCCWVELGACSDLERVLSDTDVPQFPAQTDRVDTVEEDVPVVYFPKTTKGLKRKKREWVVPPLNVPENDRGPFPKKVSQIGSSNDKDRAIHYSITGPGANEPPVDLFIMDRESGVLSVTQPLDREERSSYTLMAYAETEGSPAESMEIIVDVVDMNDHRPIFTQDTYTGQVSESAPINFEILQVKATDADQEWTANSAVRYRIANQEPKSPSDDMFTIHPLSGFIRLSARGLDRERISQYSLEVQAADMEGEGVTGSTRVILTVTDGNDHAPIYTQTQFSVTVPQKRKGALVVRMSVTDGDDAHTPAWNAKFTIVNGNRDGLFTVATGTNKQEGIITTAKGLDFETASEHTLLVAVENEVPFAVPLPTSTATVTVTVSNETATFEPTDKPEPAHKQTTWNKIEENCVKVDKDIGGFTMIFILIPVTVVINVTVTVLILRCQRRTQAGRTTGGGGAPEPDGDYDDVHQGSQNIYEHLNLEEVEPSYGQLNQDQTKN